MRLINESCDIVEQASAKLTVSWNLLKVNFRQNVIPLLPVFYSIHVGMDCGMLDFPVL